MFAYYYANIHSIKAFFWIHFSFMIVDRALVYFYIYRQKHLFSSEKLLEPLMYNNIHDETLIDDI